jgi:putative membrane protein
MLLLPAILVATIAATGPTPPANAPLRAVAIALQAKLDDPTIVAIFDAANTMDIEAATIAARKATTPEIREFAAMLIKAHTGARQQGRDLTKKLGVTPTPPAVNPFQASHDAAMKQLRTLRGKAFDREFLENEIAYHKAVIAAVQNTLLPAIQNAELKALVVHVAPVFVQHEMAAEQLLAQMNK